MDVALVAFASATAQGAVLLRGGEPIRIGWLLGFAALAVVLLHVFGPKESVTTLHDARVVLSATSLAALGTLALRMQVGPDLAAAVETIRQWSFVAAYPLAARVGLAWRAGAPQVAVAGADAPALEFELLAARELARARRHARNLSLLAFDIAGDSANESGRRGSDLRRLTASLAESLRITDAIGTRGGRVLVLLTELESQDVDAVLGRLREELDPDVASRLEVGSASFPDEEVTFVGLRERALEGRRRLCEPPTIESDLELADSQEAIA
jgi:hypothetical protein